MSKLNSLVATEKGRTALKVALSIMALLGLAVAGAADVPVIWPG